jgi:hypothetical protein
MRFQNILIGLQEGLKIQANEKSATTKPSEASSLGLSTGPGPYGLPVGLPVGIPAETLTCRSRLPVAAGP